MQIGGKCIQNLLVNMVLESKLSKDTFPCLFTWEWVKKIPIWNCPNLQCIMTYGT